MYRRLLALAAAGWLQQRAGPLAGWP